jgi:hypothetical protein
MILSSVRKMKTKIVAITQKALKQTLVLWRSYDQDLADSGEHKRRQGIIDHRLVEHREELFGDHSCQGIEPRASSAR